MRSLKMVVPKGRLYDGVVRLLNDSGFGIEVDERVYVPRVRDPEVEAKLMKPQDIPRLVELGSHDIGFCGHDWVRETGTTVTEVMDLALDPVTLVAAVPEGVPEASLTTRRLVVATEYENIARAFLSERGYQFIILRTNGATEVFPPDDADMIIDNVSTGRTLRRNGLRIVARLLESSTRFVANAQALSDGWRREKIEQIGLLLRSVIDARQRVMVEMNVNAGRLDAIVAVLPCMRAPTVARLYGEDGYAVKAAVRRDELSRLLPLLKKLGATDILEYEFRKVLL